MTEDAGTVDLSEEELEGAARSSARSSAPRGRPGRERAAHRGALIAAAAKFNITLHEEDAADMIDMFSGSPPGEMGSGLHADGAAASRGALTR